MGILFTALMGFLLTITMGFLFTTTMGFLFTTTIGIQFTISNRTLLSSWVPVKLVNICLQRKGGR